MAYDVAGPHGLTRCAALADGGSVREYVLGPGYRLGAHTHYSRGIALGLGGTYVGQFGRREHALTRGQALIFPDGARHRERAGRDGSHCLLLQLEPAACDAVPPAVFARERLIAIPALARAGPRMVRELAVADSASPISLAALIAEVVGELAAVLDGDRDDARGWVWHVREQLDACYLAPPTLAALARSVGRTREHVARTFRREFGATIGQHIRARRLDHAARQLVATDHPVARVASDAGFADQSHFTRWFRRRYELTPARYRAHREERH